MAIEKTYLLGKNITLGCGFDLQAKAPLDSRQVVPEYDGLQALIDGNAAYEGMIVYDEGTKKTYQAQLVDGVLAFREFGINEAELKALIASETTAAMEFKGAATALPENPSKGDFYKVTTSFDVAEGETAKIGDSIVYDGEQWFIIPSGDDIEDTWRPVTGVDNDSTLTFEAGDKLEKTVAADGTITYKHVAIDAPTATPVGEDEQTRTYIASIETDGHGHITGYKTATENVEDTNTEYTFEGQSDEATSVYFQVTSNEEGASAEVIYLDAYSKNEADGKFVAKETGKSLVSDDEIARLAEVDNYDDEEVRGLIGDNAKAIEDLEAYVGTIPTDEKYADVTNVISYVNKKAEETLAAAQGGSSETAASVKQQLDNYKSENDTRVKAAEDAIDAIEEDSHTHANKDLLDTYTQTEANLADAVAKKHAHTFVEAELNKIADGDVAKWNAAEQNANKYTDDVVVALGLSSDDANLIVTNKNVVVHGDIVAQGYEDDELGPQGGTIRAESFYSTAENCYLATSNAVETAIDVANRYTDNLGTVDADNTKITIDKDVYLYSKQVGSEEFAYVNLYIDDNKVATEVAVDEKIDALDLANTYQPKGDYATEEHTHTKDEITDFAHTHVAADITDLDSTIKGYDYATKTELDKKADKTQVATDIANAIAPLATTEALNGVKATAEAAAVKTDVDAALLLKADKSVVDAMYTNTQIDTAVQDAKDYAKGLVDAIPAQTDYSVICSDADFEATTDAPAFKRHTLTQNGKTVCTIDIPKELVVEAGSVKAVTEEDKPYAGAEIGDKYIELVIANQDEPIYVPAKDLVDIYTAKDGATEVQVAISNTNEISATLVNGGITEEKLAEGVKTKLNKTWEEVGVAAGLVEGLENGQVKVNKEAIEKLNGADTVDGSVAKSIKDAIEGENLGQYAKTADLGDLAALDTITADKVTDFATEVAKVKVDEAVKADEATKAAQDGNGKVIADTYAEKATTLAGYGIADAYTKDEIVAMFTWGTFGE